MWLNNAELDKIFWRMKKKMYFCTQLIERTMTTKVRTMSRFAALDMILVGAACLIPAMSHLFAAPLYVLNPMLALLLVGILLGRDWRNALVLAVLMPLVSCLLAGMPAAPKMVCMVAELLTVAGLFHLLSQRWNVALSVFFAILAGKAVYYALKMLILAPAVLVSTEWWMQLGTIVVWGGLFAMLYKRVK